MRAFTGSDQAARELPAEWKRRTRRGTEQGALLFGRFRGRLEEQLDIGRIQISAGNVIGLTVATTAIVVFLLSLVSGIVAVLGFATPLVARALIRRKVRKVRDEFAEQLPPNLQVLASALRAGHSFNGAFRSCIDHAHEPSRSELSRAITDEQLGMPMDDAIRKVSVRMKSRDLEQVALLAELQRTTGGNAAEILDTVVATLRERADIRRLVQTLTAQGRMARLILTALPVVTGLAFWAIQPNLFTPFLHAGVGQVLFVAAAIMIGFGSIVIQRIVEIEV
jgi:tight adherence protein B